jgi:hypothetical protein
MAASGENYMAAVKKLVQARILVISDLMVDRGKGLGRGEGRWLL